MQHSYLLLSISVVLLGGCGGGGGGGSATPTIPTPSPGISNNVAVFTDDVYSGSPGRNLVIAKGSSSNDITASGGINLKYTEPLNWLGWDIANANGTELSIVTPPQAVRQAWADRVDGDGTGMGVNVLVMDHFHLGDTGADSINNNHGYGVASTVKSIAPNANLFSVHRYGRDDPTNMVTNMLMDKDTKIDVINLSIASNFLTAQQVISNYHPTYTGDSDYVANSGDAVLVKSAGNSGVDAYTTSYNEALIIDTNTQPRALIVGWLDSNTQLLREVDDCSTGHCSNFAGDTMAMQDRFLVDYSIIGFAEPTFALCPDGDDTCSAPSYDLGGANSNGGTSNAAPTVSGLAAIYRSKFLNQSGEQTATQLLNTAGYDNLACYDSVTNSGCAENIYGQGQINLMKALSPVRALQ